MIAPEPTIQDILSQGVSGTSLERVFLARAQPHGGSFAISIAAYCPGDAVPPRSILQAARWAARWAIVSARPLLLAGRSGGRHRREHAAMLTAVPVILDDQRVWGAVVALGPAAPPNAETMATLERLAQQLAVRLTPRQRPATAVRMPPPRSNGGMEWTEGAAHDTLLHELRTPLGAASHALDAVVRVHDGASNGASRADAAQIAPMLRTARCGVREAQSLVRWFSQLRTIAQGSPRPTVSAVAVTTIIARAVTLVPNARVQVVVAPDVPPVAADELWLTQTLINLIDNAVKHTRSAEPVQVAVRRAAPDRVLISVIDTGAGVPLERQREIFSPYVSGARSDDLTSQGLGLSIARYFVTAMGGDMWLESDGHSGTTLSFTLAVASGDDS
jgi:signal transduction histidine kinase